MRCCGGGKKRKVTRSKDVKAVVKSVGKIGERRPISAAVRVERLVQVDPEDAREIGRRWR
jgi:hypothetical protein